MNGFLSVCASRWPSTIVSRPIVIAALRRRGHEAGSLIADKFANVTLTYRHTTIYQCDIDCAVLVEVR
jgi:hypothetical protein